MCIRDRIRTRGGPLLITARFIPGGRTALTVTSGITRQDKRWFMGWVAVAVTIWATYAAVLGYIGGKTFGDNHTLAFLVAFGAALIMTGIIEVVRKIRGGDDDEALDDGEILDELGELDEMDELTELDDS